MADIIPNTIQDNPAVKAKMNVLGKSFGKKGNGSEAGERLFLTRPRWASDDTTNRGTYAYIKLMTSSEQASIYADGSSSRTNEKHVGTALKGALATMSSSTEGLGYDKFLLTSISAGMDEKIQITEVFGDNEVAYYFGRAPMIFNFAGTLIDSPDTAMMVDGKAEGGGWFADWLEVYDGALRGTELAKNFELLKIVLPNMTIVGSMTNFHWTQDSTNDVAIPFSFQFLVKQLVPTPVKTLGAISDAAGFINFDSVESFVTRTEINTLRKQGAEIMGVLSDPSSTLGSLSSAMSSFGSGVPASLGIGGTSSSMSNWIDGISDKFSSGSNSLRGIFSSITSGLDGIRASLFSPIYGVMNSLTRLVKNVFGAGGLSGIFNALTAPIKNILGDITRIFTQASAVVGMVTQGIAGLGRGLAGGFGLAQSFQQAVRAFKHTAGCIAAVPLTVSGSVKGLVNGGHIHSSAAFLKSNPKHSLSRPATLSSAKKISGSGASLNNSHAGLSPQLAIISGVHKPSSTIGASL